MDDTGHANPGHPRGTRIWFYLLILAFLIICFNRQLVPSIRVDWLNVIPLVATLYVGYCVVSLEKTCGHIAYVRRCLSKNPSTARPRGAFLLSPWMRSCFMLLVAIVATEFGLRCFSYHRSLAYERQGDLLFTPIPKQVYVEKISLTHSVINSYGLRGAPVDTSPGKITILCLGDSITYGYGVDDNHSYPARLQSDLNREFPGRFTVLNGGVDAYPLALEDKKLLYLWSLGLRPNVAIVGYSMNEGALSRIIDSDEEIKREFAQRVWLKNHVRAFALYNLIVENWARTYYDRMKGKLVPGSNFAVLSREELDKRYDGYMTRLVSDLRMRDIKPVFLLFCSFNGQTGHYDTEGPFARKFENFARTNGLPLFRSDEMLFDGNPRGVNLGKYFIDGAHMNNLGTEKIATKLAEALPSVLTTTHTPATIAGAKVLTDKTTIAYSSGH